MKTILSLFDYSGNWSRPYKEAGYNVYRVDVKHDIDILSLDIDRDIKPLGKIYGILAAPPCTDFAGSGAQYWKAKDADGRTARSLALIHKSLEIIDKTNPVFWALENPVGRLPTLVPKLGKPWYFNPHEFAGWLHGEDAERERYTKRTGIWGVFNRPEKTPLSVVPGCNPIMSLGGKSERTKELRSMTPMGFAYAFYEANK
jgi:hypothetical protein